MTIGAVLVAAYVVVGLCFGAATWCGWAARFPRQNEGTSISDRSTPLADGFMSVLMVAIWPALGAFGWDTVEVGFRYLTTDWDPWEEKRGHVTLKMNATSMTMPGFSLNAAPSGYDGPKPKTVEGSEVLTGHRVWRLFEDEDGPVLGSTIAPYLYEGPVARTIREELEEGRGLFAAKPDQPFYKDPRPHYVVEGEVELFGRVIEGERGYRAEKLRITSLTLHPGGWHRPQTTQISPFTSTSIPEGVGRQFCSCEDSARPWPQPFTEIVEALEDRYRCDVSYAPRPERQVFDRSCNRARQYAGAFTTTLTWDAVETESGTENPNIIDPASLIETPDQNEIQQYGRPHGHR